MDTGYLLSMYFPWYLQIRHIFLIFQINILLWCIVFFSAVLVSLNIYTANVLQQHSINNLKECNNFWIYLFSFINLEWGLQKGSELWLGLCICISFCHIMVNIIKAFTLLLLKCVSTRFKKPFQRQTEQSVGLVTAWWQIQGFLPADIIRKRTATADSSSQ